MRSSMEAHKWTGLGSDLSRHGHKTPVGCEVEPPYIKLVPEHIPEHIETWKIWRPGRCFELFIVPLEPFQRSSLQCGRLRCPVRGTTAIGECRCHDWMELFCNSVWEDGACQAASTSMPRAKVSPHNVTHLTCQCF